MTTAIRELSIADEAMVFELLDAFDPGWSDDLAPGASGPLAFVADPQTFGFGAYVDHDPAGWLWGAHVRHPDGRIETYVHTLLVAQPFRRRGIGSSLLDAALGLARRQGARNLRVIGSADSAAARAFVDRSGGSRLDGEAYTWTLV